MPGRESAYTHSSGSENLVYLHDGDHITLGGRSVHSPTSTESQSGHSSGGSWAHVERPDVYDTIKPSDSASRSRRSSVAPAPAPAPPTRRHSSRSTLPDEARRYTSHRSRSTRHHRGESRRIPSDESTSTLASGDDYPYAGMPPPQQRGYRQHPASHAGYPPSVGSAAQYQDAFTPSALVHRPVDAFGYPVSNPFAGGQPNPFAPMQHGAGAPGYFPQEPVPHPPRPHPQQRMSMYAAPPSAYGPEMHYGQMMPHAGYPMYPPMGYMHPPSPPVADANNAKQFDSLKEIIKKHEEERLAWEKAMVARVEAEAAAKAAEKAKAEAEDKKKEEIAAASTKAKEAAEKKAEEAAKKAKEEAEKKLAEAQKAKEEAEKKSKDLEKEKKDNAPIPDALEKPIKFKDVGNRKFSFPWALCKTWKGMEGLVKQAFSHVEPFHHHVLEGRYDLIGPDGEIILPQVWETTVKPGWDIEMVMWPMDELEPVKHQHKGDPLAGFDLDDLMNLSIGPAKAGKNKSSSKKVQVRNDKGKRGIIAVPPPPPAVDPLAEFAHLFPPNLGASAMVVEDKRKPSKSGSSKKSKEVPALMRWMYGPPPKKKA